MPDLFKPNPGAAKELAHSSEARSGLREFAQRAADASTQLERARHPKGAIMPRGGDQFVVQETEDGWVVVNTDYGAAITEFGTSRTPPEAPLRRGVQAAGLTLRKTD